MERTFRQVERLALDLIRERLVETFGCTIAMHPLVMKLQKILEILCVFLSGLYRLMMTTFFL